MKTDSIFINGRFLTQPITGVQRYAVEMLTALDQIYESLPGCHFPLVCLVPNTELKTIPAWQHIKIRKVGPFSGNLWEQTTLPRAASGGLLFSPCNIGPFMKKNQVITIHDASVFACKEVYTFSFRLKYVLNYRLLGSIVPQIITVSQFSKKELIHYCGFSPDRVQVVYNGCDHQVPSESITRSEGNIPTKPYILAVGSLSKHKNLQAIIQSADQLPGGIQIVIAGNSFSKVFANSQFTNSPRVTFTGYVSEEQLTTLYQHAFAFVFPSKYEGFGIPVLEAMRNGCPVISSNRASLPEVCGDAALYFDPDSSAEIPRLVTQLYSNPDLRTEFVEKGKVRAEEFTWEKCARATWDILNRIKR